MKQNQCLRRHPCANCSLCVWFPGKGNFSDYCLIIFHIIAWKYFFYYWAVKIFHQHDFNDQSSMKCAKSNRRCWELAAIKIKYNKNVQFWTQLEKNRWIKKSQCAKWQSPISDWKREFFSINLLTVIVRGSEEILSQTTHQEASFSILEAWGQTRQSGELPPSPSWHHQSSLPRTGFLLTFMLGLAGTSVGLKTPDRSHH